MQECRHGGAVSIARDVERSAALRVRRVRIGAVREEQLGALKIAGERGGVKRRRTFPALRVRIGARLEEQADDLVLAWAGVRRDRRVERGEPLVA